DEPGARRGIGLGDLEQQAADEIAAEHEERLDAEEAGNVDPALRGAAEEIAAEAAEMRDEDEHGGAGAHEIEAEIARTGAAPSVRRHRPTLAAGTRAAQSASRNYSIERNATTLSTPMRSGASSWSK